MKWRATLFFLLSGISLWSQVDFKTMAGDWMPKSFTKNGTSMKVDNLSFSISDTDLGNFVLVQTYYDSENGACEWIVNLVPKAGNKVEHDLLFDEEGCKCNLTGEYSYELKDGLLTISNSKDKLVLYRKS